ncbi:MAG: phosphate ABC transporter permease subunit PstC [Candidatus Zixiibacteriota bacterium]|nr:MAG: phosphate ABC transporter permease subunit PstC [candidate division Zixibacteria bacterium]
MSFSLPWLRSQSKGDPLFRWIALVSAFVIPLLMAGILVELIRHSSLAMREFGFGFLTTNVWNPVTEEYGALSSIFGTAASTLIAMLIALPLGLVIAVFLVELAPPKLSALFGTAIELLAAIPSIIYGMWGLFIFAPFLSNHIYPVLGKHLGFLPLFSGPPMGIGILTAGIILAFMILPYISSVTRDIIHMVPPVVKEAAYGVGATNWEVTRGVTLRYSLRGIVGAAFLGLGRALGETMAVTFVIGNDHKIGASLFASGNTIASTLANEFSEASEPLYLSALVELGLVLFVMTVIFQAAAQIWLWSIRKKLA